MGSIRLTLLGDISLDGKYSDFYTSGINPFESLEDEFAKSDFVIGNLESTVEGATGYNLLKKPRLKTTSETLNYLKTLKITSVGLANNHVYDNLRDGFDNTLNALDLLNITHFGAGRTQHEAESELILKKMEYQSGY